MSSPYSLPLQTNPQFTVAPLRNIDRHKRSTLLAQILVLGGGHESSGKRRTEYKSCSRIHAVEKDSQQYEIDQDKAKEALEKLDEQIQSLSNKQVNTPRIRASDVRPTSEPTMKEEQPEISGSFLTYSAFFLLAFTFLYNLLFYTVIKPSVDGPEYVPSSSEERVVSEDSTGQGFSQSLPDSFFQR